MIKRYCDRCGQQIDEGVHAWYVLELHGTDGEFRHKELCEECYEYLCEKDEAPKADRKTESNSEKPNNSTSSKMEQVEDEPQTDKDFEVTYTCSFTDCDNFKNFGFGEKCIECKRKQSEAKYKDEPQTNHLVKTPRKSRESHEIADAPLTDAEITELAKEIIHKMIDNSVIAEDAYPDLRQRMHEAVERLDEYYPSEDERSE